MGGMVCGQSRTPELEEEGILCEPSRASLGQRAAALRRSRGEERAWYAANRELILAKGRQRYAEPGGKRKAWYEANRDRLNEKQKERR